MRFKGLKVILTDSSSRQILPIMEELAHMGCNITTISSSKLDVGYVSKYPQNKILVKNITKDNYIKVLLDVLKKNKYDVMIPLSDMTMDLVTKHYEELSNYTRLPIPKRDTFLKAYNKQNTMMICMENGIPCPITKREDESIEDFIKKVGFPIIAKPRMACGSIGLKVINDLKRYYDMLRSKEIIIDDYVIQEFIPQNGTQYNMHAFVDGNGEISFKLLTEKNRWFPIDGGASCMCRTVKNEVITDTCCRLLNLVDWRSYCDIDLILDPRDNVVKVIEINGRASANIKICDLSGINVAKELMQLAYGEDVSKYDVNKYDVRMRFVLTDVLWFIKAKDRFKRKPSWFSLKNTHDQMFSIKDPLPFFAYALQIIPKYAGEMKKRKR